MTDVAPETVYDIADLRQMASAPSDAYSAGAWCQALNEALEILARLRSLLLRAEEERNEATSLGFILSENQRLRKAASQVLHEYDLWAEDANDGEFAIWSRDEFMASFMRLRTALATPEETKARPEGREGMVTVYDDQDRYVGCMGRETWEGLLAEETKEAASKRD